MTKIKGKLIVCRDNETITKQQPGRAAHLAALVVQQATSTPSQAHRGRAG
jgi:hypothetical protein